MRVRVRVRPCHAMMAYSELSVYVTVAGTVATRVTVTVTVAVRVRTSLSDLRASPPP